MTKLLDRAKKILLTPFSSVWESVYYLRRRLYRQGIFHSERFGIPVISVGNLTFGGTGKTPMIAWLSQYLVEKGKTPVILTRGYKGRYEHSSGIIVSGQRFKNNPADFGDEPLLLSRRLTKGAVIVGKRRAANFKKHGRDLNADVLLLDDGFQHLQMKRDLNIVLFDSTASMDTYSVAPLGLMREGMDALDDADIIIFSKADQVSSSHLTSLSQKIRHFVRDDVVFAQIRYNPKGLLNTQEQLVADLGQMKGIRAIGLAAIASPKSFFLLLESLGVHLVEKLTFPDHHFFTHEEVNDFLLKSSQQSAIIIASEKDIVKLKRVTQDVRLSYLSIEVSFMTGQEEVCKKLEQVLRKQY